jgi:putative endonuclease
MPTYHVYIMASRSRALYIGVTNNIAERVEKHRRGEGSLQESRYHENRLVYVERYEVGAEAFARETQHKKWRRDKKLALIESLNPDWLDLTEHIDMRNLCAFPTPPFRA